MKSRTFPIFLAFLCMGFGDAVGPFVGLAKDYFTLSNTMAQLIPFVGFMMFGLFSIPMGLFQDKKGKKTVLLLGLCIALFGMLIPSIAGLQSYAVFLITILLLGLGAATLQVAGNPIMRDVSEEGKYSRNLSLGQFIKAIGSLSGPLIPAAAAFIWGGSWEVIFPIYGAALALTILSVSLLRVREQKPESRSATFGSCFSLLVREPFVLMMVLAIFMYVGAEVCMSTGIPLYLKSQYDFDISKFGVLGTGLFFLALTIGRFLGGVILNWMRPKKFFVLTVLVSAVAILGLFSGSRGLSLGSVFVIGLGFANIFPLVFSITVDTFPSRSNELSGLMVTAIVGGALIPPVMGLVADHSNILMSFLVPLAAILFVLFASLAALKKA